MEAGTLVEATLRFVRENEALVEAVLFGLAFGESIVLFSFFIPASLLFLAIGGLHGASGGDLLPLVIAGTLGAFLGDLVSYWIGWRYRHDLQQRWPFRRYPDWLPKARLFFDKWGIMGIVVAKFIGPMRPLVPTISGAVSMPGGMFVAASAISSFVWALVFLVPTFYGVEWLMR
jgi:membrane protein DedA with SNARE-associated domain